MADPVANELKKYDNNVNGEVKKDILAHGFPFEQANDTKQAQCSSRLDPEATADVFDMERAAGAHGQLGCRFSESPEGVAQAGLRSPESGPVLHAGGHGRGDGQGGVRLPTVREELTKVEAEIEHLLEGAEESQPQHDRLLALLVREEALQNLDVG